MNVITIDQIGLWKVVIPSSKMTLRIVRRFLPYDMTAKWFIKVDNMGNIP